MSSIEDKDRDDVMERLLELGGDKKYLTFDDLNRELPDNVVSPDDIEDVLQKLEGSNIPVADSDERLLEQAAVTVTDDDEESLDEDIELDLSAGALEKTVSPTPSMNGSRVTGSSAPWHCCNGRRRRRVTASRESAHHAHRRCVGRCSGMASTLACTRAR